VPTRNRAGGITAIADPEIRGAITLSRALAERHGITLFDIDDPRQGIIHVTMPELGISLPGLTIACGDSHTTTHGGLGALGLGIGLSEQTHVLATQTLWHGRARQLEIEIGGRFALGVTAKDLALEVVRRLGAGGAGGHFVEFVGAAVRALSIEARMTLCNMAVEAGARGALVAPDDTTYAWLAGRPFCPTGEEWDAALAYWRGLPSDPGAAFDRTLTIAADDIAPVVTWGTSPEDVVPVGDRVPDPAAESDPVRRERMHAALAYMGLVPGTEMTAITIDRVFIGSCTNGRLEDLRAAAAIARGSRAVVPTLVVPGSMAIKHAAEAEGLDRVFRDAGFEWRDPGCSMCVGMNRDLVLPQERCASTSNRNFAGRQGPGSRTHLMSPAMAAAAACAGRIADVREFLSGYRP
jgi:3-isopropylmalate/(R)-2-methylmalate dehydratase large subunit